MSAHGDDAPLERQLEELAALHDSLRALTSTLDLGEILRMVLARIRALIAPEALSLLLFDRERNELVFAATQLLRERTVVGNGVPSGPDDDAELAESPERIVLALRRQDRPVGRLVLDGALEGVAFDAGTRARLAAIGDELDRSAGEGLARDPDALRRLFARLSTAVPYRAATLTLYDAQGHRLVFRSSRDLQPGVIDGIRLRLDRGIAGWVARHRQPVRLDDASTDPRHDHTLARQAGLVPHGMICVPLLHRDRLLGVVQVINRLDGRAFTADQQRVVKALANHAAIAIANAQLYHEVEQASLTDDLTGLGNTRCFHRVLPVLMERDPPLSLLVLDLDKLKAVVDGFGHLVGSRTIATVGRLIAEQLRPGDVAARFGGDEFVVLLPSTDTGPAREVAESIRAAVAACATPDDIDVDIRTVTASLGVATAPRHATDPDGLFRAADEAMYTVKRGSRNGVGIA